MSTTMSTTEVDRNHAERKKIDYDVLVVGAGFSGIYMLHKLRELGFRARVLELGDGVGGTWYWNRYPGARCDVESIEYSYSFSKEIEQEWSWSELMPAQAELEGYLNYVVDRLELRPDIQLETRVVAAEYSEENSTWTLATDAGETLVSSFCVMATGCLSVPLEPSIAGLDSFGGTVLKTAFWPREGVDLRGKRVGVIGTGSSGVQCIPEIARQAAQLVVFQRSAAFTRPANNRHLDPAELADLKAQYPEIRAQQKGSFAGALRIGALAISDMTGFTRKIRESSAVERERALEELSWGAPLSWADVMVDPEANEIAVGMYAELVRGMVTDRGTAQSLIPHYPLGCKRQVIDTNYFNTFNLEHVTLVDLRKGAITRVDEKCVHTEQGEFELDVIVLATGFDAMTGALNRIDIRGRGGKLLREYWGSEGPKTYLGLQVVGYPNLFTITGPGSPSVATNMVVSIEDHVEWIGQCLSYLRETGGTTIEATEAAQEEWVEHAAAIVEGRVYTWDTCNSWYLGANVPGKKRVHMPYRGGLPSYRQKCDEVAIAGYKGFEISSVEQPQSLREQESGMR
jgi:cation diffusion facilitator CzcD-associated flavoprotein CzcO